MHHWRSKSKWTKNSEDFLHLNIKMNYHCKNLFNTKGINSVREQCWRFSSCRAMKPHTGVWCLVLFTGDLTCCVAFFLNLMASLNTGVHQHVQRSHTYFIVGQWSEIISISIQKCFSDQRNKSSTWPAQSPDLDLYLKNHEVRWRRVLSEDVGLICRRICRDPERRSHVRFLALCSPISSSIRHLVLKLKRIKGWQ